MSDILRTTCCIVGGGPAGMMAGFLFARAGIDVIVLEKHADFFRDFRGDTIHPSTLQLMHELGLLDEFLKLPHDRTPILRGYVGQKEVTLADFSHLPTACKFIAFMPQWDFLNFIAAKAKAYPSFRLIMEAQAYELVERNGKIAGVRVRTSDGELEIDASLTLGADGRHSLIREKAGFKVHDTGAPIDVLWLRLPRHADDPQSSLGRIGPGKMFVMLDRGSYWQCAFVIAKGGYEKLQNSGLEHFRQEIISVAPFLRDRVQDIRSWDDIKLLTVTVDHLEEWCRPGLLCIGDAAHAMSPVGGVGINLAIQDAVATANILSPYLKKGNANVEALRKVQQRRKWPARMTQRFQVFMQDRVIMRALQSGAQMPMPFIFRLAQIFPVVSRIMAHIIGIGLRPEHISLQDKSE